MRDPRDCPTEDCSGDTEGVHREERTDAVVEIHVCHDCGAQWEEHFGYSHTEVFEQPSEGRLVDDRNVHP